MDVAVAGSTDIGLEKAMDSEFVSVVVPAFNAEKTIDETLLSIRRQTHRNLEIIVVDDGSADSTYQRAADHSLADRRIRVIRQENGGVAAARNRGIAEARADLIAPIDADDLWRPSKISRQLDVLRSSGPESKLVYTWSASVDEDGRVIDWGTHPNISGKVLSDLCEGNFVGNGSTALMQKSVFDEVGGYDPSLRDRQAQGCEDWSLFLKIAEIGHFAVVPDHLTGYRQVRNAMSRDVEQMLRSDAIVRSELLARYPEYWTQIKSGRLGYIDWMFRRELEDGSWLTSIGLLHRLLLQEDSGPPSARRIAKYALRIAARAFRGRLESTRGPEYVASGTSPAPEGGWCAVANPSQDSKV